VALLAVTAVTQEPLDRVPAIKRYTPFLGFPLTIAGKKMEPKRREMSESCWILIEKAGKDLVSPKCGSASWVQ
jgi:hypothetical protein